MRLVSIEIGFGLNDPPQVLLDIPDGWDLEKRYQEWHPAHKFFTFAEYLKQCGAKESKSIERYP